MNSGKDRMSGSKRQQVLGPSPQKVLEKKRTNCFIMKVKELDGLTEY